MQDLTPFFTELLQSELARVLENHTELWTRNEQVLLCCGTWKTQIEKTKKKERNKSSQSNVIRKSYLIIEGRPPFLPRVENDW